MKIGIIPYLEDLAGRFDHIAKASTDPNTQFALGSLSVEIASKAHELGEAFIVDQKPRRSATEKH